MWRRGSYEGCRELMKTGKESTGKGGFSQSGKQVLPQKVTAAKKCTEREAAHFNP